MMELQLFPQMKVTDLADRMNVSPETIRRDLAALQTEGKLERTFGGAVGLGSVVPGVSERQKLMVEERDRISSLAASLIEPNDVIMVGGGSTTMRFALKVARLNFPITVVTHSLPFAVSVGKNRNISVEMLPGRLNPDEGLLSGISTIKSIRMFSAHKAFIGASGVNEAGLHALLEPGEVYREIIEASQHTYVLVDSTKFGAMALARYAEWSDSMTIITDKMPEARLARALEAAGVNVRIA